MDMSGNTMADDDNDEDFEAELAALAAGNDTSYKSRRGELINFCNCNKTFLII